MSSTLLSFAGQGRVYKGSGSVTTSALAAAGAELLTFTDANVAVNDVIHAEFDIAAIATAGLPHIIRAWCSVAGTVSVTVKNSHASAALDAGAKTVNYTAVRTV